jgi:acyl carrier protein
MSDEDGLAARVIDIIVRKQKLAPGQVTIETTFDELKIDSLDRMDLLFEFEEAFNVTIPDDLAHQVKGVRQIVDGLRAMTSGAAGVPPVQGQS